MAEPKKEPQKPQVNAGVSIEIWREWIALKPNKWGDKSAALRKAAIHIINDFKANRPTRYAEEQLGS